MKAFTGISVVLFILYIAGCSSWSVKTDYDHAADFGSLKAYRWANATEINPDDELQKNPLLQKRIINAINKVMGEKGFSLSEAKSVDFVMMVHAGIKEKMQVTDWGNRGWYDPWWGPYGSQVDVSHYEEGTLVIDVVSMPGKHMIWRGLATGILRDTSPDEQEERANLIVSEILKDFPPKK